MLSSYPSQDIISCDKKGRLILKLDDITTVQLTRREAQIFQCVLQGYSAKRIGQSLGISYRTVESYISVLKDKLCCDHKNDIIILCIRLGILKLSFSI